MNPTQQAFLEAHPEVAAALEQVKNPVHSKNTFALDVAAKFERYGSLSEAQATALINSLARDVERAAEAAEPKGPAPVGRVIVTGTVLSTKVQSSQYGDTLKMLVKLENNSRVWVSAPKDRTVEKGQSITFTATFERSKTDESFAFGNRPVFGLSGSTSSVPDAPAPLSASIADIDAAKPVRAPRAPREAPAPSILAELLLELEN